MARKMIILMIKLDKNYWSKVKKKTVLTIKAEGFNLINNFIKINVIFILVLCLPPFPFLANSQSP